MPASTTGLAEAFGLPEPGGRPLRLQLVVAHPDDETFGCGSLLLHAAEEGAVTSVCCATRGEAWRSARRGDRAAGRRRRVA